MGGAGAGCAETSVVKTCGGHRARKGREERMKGEGEGPVGSQRVRGSGSGGRGALGSRYVWRVPRPCHRPQSAMEGMGAPRRRRVLAPARRNACQVKAERLGGGMRARTYVSAWVE